MRGLATNRVGLLLAFVVAVVSAALVGAEAQRPWAVGIRPGLGANPSAAVAAFACLHLPLARVHRPPLLAAGIIFGTRLLGGEAVLGSAAASLGATVHALTLVLVLVGLGPGRNTQRSLGGSMWLAVAVAAGAVAGGTVEVLVGPAPLEPVPWAATVLGHGLGVATTLPFMLAWRRPPTLQLGTPARLFEAAGLVALWGTFAFAVTTGASARHPETLLLLVPAFTWTAARFGLTWATLGNLLFVLFVHDTGMLDAASPTWLLSQRTFILLLVVASHSLAVLIEDREKALRALAMSEQRMRAVLASIPELVLQVDAEGDVVVRLGAGDDIVGAPATDQDPLATTFGPSYVEVRAAVQAVLLDSSVRALDVDVPTARGPRTLEVRVSVLEDPVDAHRSALITARDVTLEREGLRRAAESEKARALRHLTGGVAHDFNNLLTAIIGNLDLLRTDLEDPDQITSLEDVARAAHRGRDLTHRLLAYSERQPLQPRTIELSEELRRVTDRLAEQSPMGISIDAPDGPERWLVNVDPKRLEAALTSLIDNAREAGGGDHEVTIRLRRVAARDDDTEAPRAYAAVEVEDRGEGMSADTLARACDPFFSTRGLGRTGLGLSMVHGFARQSGGMFRLSSERGQGTRAAMLLPLYELPDPDACRRIHDASMVVLVADRDPEVRRLVSRHVIRRGYIPVEAASVAEVTGLLDRFGPVALVVSELDLSGPHSGLSAVERHPAQPLMLLVEREPIPGPIPVIRKPFAPGELTDALARVLRARTKRPPPGLAVEERGGPRPTV